MGTFPIILIDSYIVSRVINQLVEICVINVPRATLVPTEVELGRAMLNITRIITDTLAAPISIHQ